MDPVIGAHVDWFDYEPLDPEEVRALLRPAIPCVVESPRRRMAIIGLVDSGSDRSVLSQERALRLGVLPRRADTQLRVFGRIIPAGRAELTIEIPVRRGVSRIGPAEWVVPLGPVDVPFPVLGRQPLFDHFEVRIQEWRRRTGLIGRDRAPVRWETERGPPAARLLPISAARRHAAAGRRHFAGG
jgi:hypothetical protein